MDAPKVIGRTDDDESTDERAKTHLIRTVSIPYEAGAIGEVTVSVFRSIGDEDRGGIVLRITLADQASSFIPFAKNIDSGVEVHMAGDIEADSFSQAIRSALVED